MSDPTKLQMLVAEISGTAESDFIGVYKQIPFRVKLHLFARLSALHDFQNLKQKKPRNALLNDLLDIALDEVISELHPQIQEELGQLEAQYYQNLECQYESGDLSDA